jgi:hypothetical protein
MNRSARGFLTLTLLVPCLLFTGCNFIKQKLEDRLASKFQKKEDSKPPPPFEGPAPTPPSNPSSVDSKMPAATPIAKTQNSDQALIEELNGYVGCLNRTSPRVNQSRQRYLSWVNEKTGPTCKEQYISYGLYTLYEDGIENCNKAAERGRNGEPSLPELEKAATDLAAAYSELVPLVQKAEDYYNQQDYKDDNCAKGKEMHAKLMEAFAKYHQAELQLQKGVDGLKGDVDKRELARLEQEKGRTLPWYSRNFSLTAKTLIQTIPTDSPQQLNPQNYLGAYAQLDKDYQAFSDYATAHPDEGKGVFWYSAFDSSAKRFYTKAKFLKRDLADGKQPDANSLNDLVQEYNSLVSDANNVKF